MPMLTEVSRKDADPFALEFYKALFGDIKFPAIPTGKRNNSSIIRASSEIA
jgi:hypothetical protein